MVQKKKVANGIILCTFCPFNSESNDSSEPLKEIKTHYLIRFRAHPCRPVKKGKIKGNLAGRFPQCNNKSFVSN